MRISTNEYLLASDLFTRVGTRVSYRRIWFVPFLGVLLAIALVITGDPFMKVIGLLEGIVIILLPMIKVRISASRIKHVPLYQLPYVMSFGEDAMTQSSGGDVRSLVRYEEIVRVQNDPEALVAFFTRSLYVFVPKASFKSTEDLAAVLAMFKSRGLIK
jgi:hypothetical protein